MCLSRLKALYVVIVTAFRDLVYRQLWTSIIILLLTYKNVFTSKFSKIWFTHEREALRTSRMGAHQQLSSAMDLTPLTGVVAVVLELPQLFRAVGPVTHSYTERMNRATISPAVATVDVHAQLLSDNKPIMWDIITPLACARRGKVIVLPIVVYKHKNCQILRSRHLSNS